ncbi:MAG TPA: helix-turn-helix domain-containing protein [Thermoanaerobaculia bacterium]|jgi:AcrR family transcriptional regulator
MAVEAKTKEQLIQEFRVQTIRDAAARVIARKGLDGATMQAIADAAGIAKGTIYLYFQNRGELLERTADHAFSQLLDEVLGILAAPGPLPERLHRLIAAQISYFDERRDFFRLYLSVRYPEGASEASRRERKTWEQHKVYVERLTVFFEEAVARGEIRPMDAARLALFVSEGVIAILIRRLAEAESVPVAEDVDWLAETILHGIALPEEEP